MAILTLNVTEEQKQFLTDYSNDKNISIMDMFTLFVEYLENMEDMEDYKLAVERKLDPNNKPYGTMEELATKYGIDYNEL